MRELPAGKAAVLVAVRILYRVIADFARGELTLRAMSLVYTTLLSLVPLLALSFSILKAFGVHNQLEPLLLNFFAPLGEKGVELANNIVRFVGNMGVGVLGFLGLIMLIYTVVALIQKIEAAFNFIWKEPGLRSLPQRLSGYLSVVLLGPMLVVTALGITATVMSSHLMSELLAIEPFGSLFYLLGKLLPYLLVIGAFTVTYLIIPNTTVRWRSALVGGIVAGVVWESAGWGFAAFIVGSVNYEMVYSGFAIVILFLIWLYLNWLVVLLGASITFYHQNPGYQLRHDAHLVLGFRAREALALEIMRVVGEAYQQGDVQWTKEKFIEEKSLPPAVISEVLDKLLSAGLLVYACDDSAHLIPGRDLQRISIKDVIDVLGGEFDVNDGRVEWVGETVLNTMRQMDTATTKHLAEKSIKALFSPQEKSTHS